MTEPKDLEEARVLLMLMEQRTEAAEAMAEQERLLLRDVATWLVHECGYPIQFAGRPVPPLPFRRLLEDA